MAISYSKHPPAVGERQAGRLNEHLTAQLLAQNRIDHFFLDQFQNSVKEHCYCSQDREQPLTEIIRSSIAKQYTFSTGWQMNLTESLESPSTSHSDSEYRPLIATNCFGGTTTAETLQVC